MPDHWLLPPKPTPEEMDIAEYCILNIYDKFADPLDKLIIMGVFELGYKQKFIADLIGRREQAVSLRLKKIRTILSQSHKAYIKP
jgi:hypothetical protein